MAKHSSAEKKRKLRQALPGFPWKGKFRTKEEIDVYFSGDRIQCLLCGRGLKALSAHLIAIHDVTSDDYREMYGLPWKRGLTSRNLNKKMSEISTRLMREGKINSVQNYQILRRKRQRRPMQPFVRELLQRKLKPPLFILFEYTREDYKKIIERMRNEQRALSDVCIDPDLPGLRTWTLFKKSHPEFEEKIKKAYYSMPYGLQIKFSNPSPRFTRDCQRLRDQKMTMKKIGKALGVTPLSVRKALMKARDKMSRPEKEKLAKSAPSRRTSCLLGVMDNRKWRRKDYEAILERMRKQQRCFYDVCGDPDLPGKFSSSGFVKRHPEFKEKLRQTYYSMPYSKQTEFHNVSPRFLEECRRLRDGGMTHKEIANALDVKKNSVSYYLAMDSATKKKKRKCKANEASQEPPPPLTRSSPGNGGEKITMPS